MSGNPVAEPTISCGTPAGMSAAVSRRGIDEFDLAVGGEHQLRGGVAVAVRGPDPAGIDQHPGTQRHPPLPHAGQPLVSAGERVERTGRSGRRFSNANVTAPQVM
ncbi:hypothetical protein [Antrihabitans spumae]|uniref:Uncharacterized protein n=1 Tax=Antrihabitans spumae TaxID=3373370 RepID=A0ABW7K2D8_9NOCA